MNNIFNMEEWAAKGGPPLINENDNVADVKHATSNKPFNATSADDVEQLVSALESRQIDITSTYGKWLNCGFALSSEFGEAGRQWYHRISCFYPDYSVEETDRQYTKCLNGKGSGITISTLFHYAKEAGICINSTCQGAKPHTPQSAVSLPETSENANSLYASDLDNSPEKDKQTANCGLCGMPGYSAPTFSDKIDVSLLPPMLHPIYHLYKEPSKCDVMLNAAITVMGPLVPNYYMYYMDSESYISNYFIVAGPFAAGKGELKLIRYILMPYEDKVKKEYEAEKAKWEVEYSNWEAMGNSPSNRIIRGPEPIKPIETSPVCSGDITEAALCQEINNNGQCIAIVGTELDDVTNMAKNNYGDYSKLLRAAWHNETYTVTRKMENLHINIRNPRIAFLYTGTTEQLRNFLPSAENGLASRISFYMLKPDYEFKNPFISSGRPMNDIYKDIGNEYCILLEQMHKTEHPIQFILTKEQGEHIFRFFSSEHEKGRNEIGDDYMGFVKRQSLNATRIAMTSALLRRFTEKKKNGEPLFAQGEQAITATEEDVELAIAIQKTLNQHTQIVYEKMKWGEKTVDAPAVLRPDEQIFFDNLPSTFTTQQAKETAKKMNFSPRSIERWLPKYVRRQLVNNPSKGIFIKCKQ